MSSTISSYAISTRRSENHHLSTRITASFNTKLYYELSLMDHVFKLKDVVDGTVVGSGTDYIVVQKGRKRILVHFPSFEIKELKNSTTPYGSQID